MSAVLEIPTVHSLQAKARPRHSYSVTDEDLEAGTSFAVAGRHGSTAGIGDEAVRELVGRTLAEVERWLILGTLESCLGNRTHAARLLGISIRTLRNKLHEYARAGFAVPEAGR